MNLFSKAHLQFLAILYILHFSTCQDLANNAAISVPKLNISLANSNATNVSSTNATNSSKTLSPELLERGFKFLRRSPTFSDYTKEEIYAILQDLNTWQAPEYFQRKFPYYHSGYDYDDRPIWISELGKYNMREVVEKRPETLPDFDKYVLQAAVNVLKSIHYKDLESPDRDINEAVFLIDYDGLDMYQLTHIPTVTFALRVARIYSDILAVALGRCIVVNANFVGELAVNLLRPILGGVLERVEVFGTNKARWIPMLRKAFPEKSIPSWYGGSQNFTPVEVFG